MSIEAIAFLPPLSMPVAPTAETAAPAPGGDFATWFGQQLEHTNDKLVTAEHSVQQLATGEASNLHQVMIDLQEARLSMQLVMQVRNHLLDGYRELMQMQV